MTAEMAAAAAAATEGAQDDIDDEVVTKHTSFSEAQKAVVEDPAAAGSGGISRADFFAKKLGKSGTAKSPGKGVEDAAEDFEEL